ncbi:GNAT family N-acetyltransferase [Microbacterium sp. M1A1_1b]
MTRTLRDLDGDDVAALQELIESDPAYAEHLTGYPPGPTDALSALVGVPEGFDPSGKRGVGLWDGPVLVAFADVLLGYPDLDAVTIGLLMVHRSHRGRGVGRELHAGVLERVRTESGAARVRVGVVATVADTAGAFWSALGYAPTGEVRPYRYDRLTSEVAVWDRAVDRR